MNSRVCRICKEEFSTIFCGNCNMDIVQTFGLCKTAEDVQNAMILFLKGEISGHPNHPAPLYNDCKGTFQENLIEINRLGFITEDSQPGHYNSYEPENTSPYGRGYINGYLPLKLFSKFYNEMIKHEKIIMELFESLAIFDGSIILNAGINVHSDEEESIFDCLVPNGHFDDYEEAYENIKMFPVTNENISKYVFSKENLEENKEQILWYKFPQLVNTHIHIGFIHKELGKKGIDDCVLEIMKKITM
jgi:hypothetical protein